MKRVLVLSTERHIARLIQVNLERQGFEVAKAATPTEALIEISQSHIDAILTDRSMRYLDGLDVFCALKRHPDTKDIPIYVVPPPGQPTPRGYRFPWFHEWTEFRDDDHDETLQ